MKHCETWVQTCLSPLDAGWKGRFCSPRRCADRYSRPLFSTNPALSRWNLSRTAWRSVEKDRGQLREGGATAERDVFTLHDCSRIQHLLSKQLCYETSTPCNMHAKYKSIVPFYTYIYKYTYMCIYSTCWKTTTSQEFEMGGVSTSKKSNCRPLHFASPSKVAAFWTPQSTLAPSPGAFTPILSMP